MVRLRFTNNSISVMWELPKPHRHVSYIRRTGHRVRSMCVVVIMKKTTCANLTVVKCDFNSAVCSKSYRHRLKINSPTQTAWTLLWVLQRIWRDVEATWKIRCRSDACVAYRNHRILVDSKQACFSWQLHSRRRSYGPFTNFLHWSPCALSTRRVRHQRQLSGTTDRFPPYFRPSECLLRQCDPILERSSSIWERLVRRDVQNRRNV